MTVIAVDFDGTLVHHRYPGIGPEVDGAFEWLAKFQAAGAKLILWTVRDGDALAAAVEYCRARGIEWWGVNTNPDQDWSASPKVFAHVYIDDAAACCPLLYEAGHTRPVVDWYRAGPSVIATVTGTTPSKE